MYKKILNYNVFSGSKEQLYNELDFNKKTHIISGNSEILYKGLKEEELNLEYNSSDSIIIPDGVGTILSSKILGNSIKRKIAGIELMDYIIKRSLEENSGIYLLGASYGTVRSCFKHIKNKYKNINLVGFSDGYFDIDNCENLIEKINNSKAKIIFIAMGSPRQEKFIIKYKDKLNCNLFMGVGGSFDIIAGKKKRAPKYLINLNLEWLYRILKEPKRVKRIKYIPAFLFLVLKERRKIK